MTSSNRLCRGQCLRAAGPRRHRARRATRLGCPRDPPRRHIPEDIRGEEGGRVEIWLVFFIKILTYTTFYYMQHGIELRWEFTYL